MKLFTDMGPSTSFTLSTAEATVATTGIVEAFDDVDAASAALRNGRRAMIVGAIPFDLAKPCALMAPRDVMTTAGPAFGCRPAPADFGPIRIQAVNPSEHIDRVAEGLALIRSGSLSKVVLARQLRLTAAHTIDPDDLFQAMVMRDPQGNGFLTDLSAAGGDYDGKVLVGASPEVLVERTGTTVRCHPLAGTTSSDADRLALLESHKDRDEHAYVVDAIAQALAPLCTSLTVPLSPSLTRSANLWHLGTAISGTLKDPSVTALDLALALHPTPAVCGIPQSAAASAIERLEPDRGFYTGAVGWTDASGNGMWRVAIRCAECSADGHELTAYAGGGVVAGSDPQAEFSETVAKFRPVLSALGAIPGHSDLLSHSPSDVPDASLRGHSTPLMHIP